MILIFNAYNNWFMINYMEIWMRQHGLQLRNFSVNKLKIEECMNQREIINKSYFLCEFLF